MGIYEYEYGYILNFNAKNRKSILTINIIARK